MKRAWWSTVLGLAIAAPTSAQPKPARTIVVISDLHFGVGHPDNDAEHWHPYEDFRWKGDFSAFLSHISAQGKGETDLILNGDSFELWQTLDEPPGCTSDQNRDLGCSEEVALKRFRRVLKQHADEMGLIKTFSEMDNNRVVFVPGNHDAALLFPKIQSELMSKVGTKVSVAADGNWSSENGKVYAEHGHQIGQDPNKMDGWPRPYVAAKGVEHLRRSWGEQFVQQVYNQYELKYPIIDNITEEQAGVRYAIAKEGAAGAALGVRRFFGFFLFGTSWNQFSRGLGDVEGHPEWDVAKMRAEGDMALVKLLEKNDPMRAAAEEALKEPAGLGNLIQSLGDKDIQELCDRYYSEELRRANDAQRHARPVCPTSQLGAIAEGTFQSSTRVLARHLDGAWEAIASKNPSQKQFVTYVYSHTHRAEKTRAVKTRKLGEVNVVNTGAWQRVVSPAWLKQKEQGGIARADILEKIPLESLPACYNFVRIAPGQEHEPKLMAWKEVSVGKWDARSGACQ